MGKTVREIAELMGIPSDDLVKEKQRIRDEIKRQNIETKKSGNKFVIADSDVEKITSALKEKLDKEDSKKKEDNEELLQMIEQLLMTLTFIFTFLKKIKKGEAYITFILYILFFCFFYVEKKSVRIRLSRFL